MKFFYTLLCMVLLTNTSLFGQLSITTKGVDYTIDFDHTVAGINNGAYSGDGFAPSPATGQIDSDGIIVEGFSDGSMKFNETHTAGDFARTKSKGAVGTGGLYAFEVNDNDMSFGIQPGGDDFTPGSIILRVINNSGVTLNSINISYTAYVYNDQNRANSFTFSYSMDNITYADISELDITSPEAKDTEANYVANQKSTTISTTLEDGSTLYLRWTGDDASGSRSRDQFALDNIVINADQTTASNDVTATIQVFPNPFSEEITLTMPTKIKTVDIFNRIGQKTKHLAHVNKYKLSIPTDDLNAGIYIIKVTCFDGTCYSQKMIKNSQQK